jgi:Glycosyltransferase family 92
VLGTMLKTIRSQIPLVDAVGGRVYGAYRRLRGNGNAATGVRLPPRNRTQPTRYLSVTAIVKNEGRYLREWIEFQRLMGVEQVYFYDNGSTDDSVQVLAPFVAEGFVTVIPWVTFDAEASQREAYAPQRQAYAHAICNFGPQFRWMAFIDLDEFLFPVTAPNLVEVLSRYEDCPCLCVPWFHFGFAGHETPPAGLVIENYTQRGPFPPVPDLLNWKSIVHPAAVVRVTGAHMFELASGITGGFDECKVLVTRNLKTQIVPRGAVLRINHYFTRSRQEFTAKVNRMATGFGSSSPQYWSNRKQRIADLIEVETVHDDVIMRFAPPLRERMNSKHLSR